VSGASAYGVVKAWDLESRLTKTETASWDAYRRCCGCSIATVWTLGDATGWKFYSDADEYPYDMKGLSDDLGAADLTLGYNTMGFDNYVLKSLVPEHRVRVELDLYQHVIKPASKVSDDHFEGAWSLGAVGQRTLLLGKTRSGAMAPTLARSNRIGELVSYNFRDVAILGRLFEHVLDVGFVVAPDGAHVDCLEVLIAAVERARDRASANAA